MKELVATILGDDTDTLAAILNRIDDEPKLAAKIVKNLSLFKENADAKIKYLQTLRLQPGTSPFPFHFLSFIVVFSSDLSLLQIVKMFI